MSNLGDTEMDEYCVLSLPDTRSTIEHSLAKRWALANGIYVIPVPYDEKWYREPETKYLGTRRALTEFCHKWYGTDEYMAKAIPVEEN